MFSIFRWNFLFLDFLSQFLLPVLFFLAPRSLLQVHILASFKTHKSRFCNNYLSHQRNQSPTSAQSHLPRRWTRWSQSFHYNLEPQLHPRCPYYNTFDQRLTYATILASSYRNCSLSSRCIQCHLGNLQASLTWHSQESRWYCHSLLSQFSCLHLHPIAKPYLPPNLLGIALIFKSPCFSITFCWPSHPPPSPSFPHKPLFDSHITHSFHSIAILQTH